jgi:hypothetical protein
MKTSSNLIQKLTGFISFGQNCALFSGLQGEEGKYFDDKINEMVEIIEKMPKTYETDGQGGEAIVYLHYFVGGCDWYITEKDMEDDQVQAFGLANLGYGGELGYINIQEITKAGAELDLHWTPKPLKEIK